MLSDHEQRMLDQLEQAMYAEDPDFASSIRGHNKLTLSWDRRKAAVGAVGFLIGLALLISGPALPNIFLGVAGFVVMLGSTLVFVWSRGPASSESNSGGESPDREHKPNKKFMSRLEERWDSRRRDGQ